VGVIRLDRRWSGRSLRSVRIYHLATVADWEQAQREGAYTTSTRGVTLEDEGFIHASRADQWEAVRERFYAGVDEPLVLLEIDTDLLDVPVVEEPPAPGVEETYPHIYGVLRPSAVVAVHALP
jgi:glutathione S-transferase